MTILEKKLPEKGETNIFNGVFCYTVTSEHFLDKLCANETSSS